MIFRYKLITIFEKADFNSAFLICFRKACAPATRIIYRNITYLYFALIIISA